MSGRTIGKHWPKNAPKGDYQALCAVCGYHYRRSQLVKRMDGKLVCSGARSMSCAREICAMELDALNSSMANTGPHPPIDGVHEGGVVDDI